MHHNFFTQVTIRILWRLQRKVKNKYFVEIEKKSKKNKQFLLHLSKNQ